MNRMRVYSFSMIFLSVSASIASAQQALTPPSSSVDFEESILLPSPPITYPLPPVTHHHKCPDVTRIVCSSTQCTANNEGVIWSTPKTPKLTFKPQPPYVADGVVGTNNAVAPGNGDIILSVTGCQYHEKGNRKNILILKVPPQYLPPCTGIKGRFGMDCKY